MRECPVLSILRLARQCLRISSNFRSTVRNAMPKAFRDLWVGIAIQLQTRDLFEQLIMQAVEQLLPPLRLHGHDFRRRACGPRPPAGPPPSLPPSPATELDKTTAGSGAAAGELDPLPFAW